ncbi:Hypothetical predicted protein [Pelobates cultripes]|uniref:Uncharacterized protein n=1 Tax=Pelobates cultripes TaxID=61616 RepID=A0AAD1RX32_PELCU|nr:Hypothetical predicted protein [Pelobates cultripes]
MAAATDCHGSSSEEDPLDAPDAIPEARDPFVTAPMGDLGAPATKGDIVNLLKNVRCLFHADMAILREDVTAVTNREESLKKTYTQSFNAKLTQAHRSRNLRPHTRHCKKGWTC